MHACRCTAELVVEHVPARWRQAAGLVAIHPIAEALKEEFFCFAWLLRREAFLRFGYDPDGVFCGAVDERGFKK